jgi:hypothetical protein
VSEERIAEIAAESSADDLIRIFLKRSDLKPEDAWLAAVNEKIGQAYGPLWAESTRSREPGRARAEIVAGAFLQALCISDYLGRISMFCETIDRDQESPLSILDRLPNHISEVIANARKILHTAGPARSPNH